MANYTKTLTESISLSEVVYPPNFGQAGVLSVYIYNTRATYPTYHQVKTYSNVRIKLKSNQMSEFEISFIFIPSTEKNFVREREEVLFFSGVNNLILKGRIERVVYSTAYSCKVFGYGMEAKLLDKEFIKSGDKRVQYTNESVQTIAKEILSSNSDGSSPWIMSPTSTGLFDVDYGDISMRYEYGNRLNCLTKLADIIRYDWWVSYSTHDYVTDYFNMATAKGSDQGVNFEITGANANCSQTSKETDTSNIVNYVYCLGYGDGLNQKKTSTYAASTTWTTLGGNTGGTSIVAGQIDDNDLTIIVADNDYDDFAAGGGTIRIAEEQILYDSYNGATHTFTVNAAGRGYNSTTARVHKDGCYIEKYVASGSPEATTSMNTYGLLDYTIIDKSIKDLPILELIASGYLIDRKDAIVRIKVIPNLPLDIAETVVLGDTVTITDAESDISGDYRVVGMTLNSEYGYLTMEIEASDKPLEFIEQLQKQREESENMAKYMQGATNIYAISNYENCDDSNPLSMRFYIPIEAVAINKVLIKFASHNFRAYTSASDTGSAHTHNLTGQATGTGSSHTHGIDISTSGGHYHTTPEHKHKVWDYVTDEIPAGTERKFWMPTSAADDSVIKGVWSVRTEDGVDHYTYLQGSLDTDNIEHGHLGETTGGEGAHTHPITGFATDSESAHTHAMSYGINEDTFPSGGTPIMTLAVGTEGSETEVTGSPFGNGDGYTNGGTISVDITDEVKTVGAGNWCNIKFTPSGATDNSNNNRVRIEANAYVQIFIEST